MIGRTLLRTALVAAVLPPSLAAARPAAHASTPIAEPQAAAPQPIGEWYFAAQGRTEGPFDAEGLIDAYLSGRIDDSTMVWWDGAKAWVPLAKATWFAELDRWYARHGSKGFGPVSGEAMRAKLAKGRAQGHDVEKLEVRLELSRWVPLASAAPLREREPAAAPPWEPGPQPDPFVDAAEVTEVGLPSASPSLVPLPTQQRSARADLPDADAGRADEHDDALDHAQKLRKRGFIVTGIGSVLLLTGSTLVTIGATRGGGPAMNVGFVIAGVALPPWITGLALLGVSKRRIQRLSQNDRVASLRVGVVADASRGGLALSGRF